MDLERERLLLRLVEEGLDRPAVDRDAFLTAATDDAALRREAVALIELEEHGGELPELAVPADVLDDGRGAVAPGTVIDGFEIVGSLGTGGMGRVFEARQLEPARHVALKTLRVGLDSKEARRRFAFEAEVLARLRHPRIAQVFAVGTFREEGLGGPRDVPYFAMEFVEGARDLLNFASDEQLPREDRIRLFLGVCDAVQHGHDRGVLHRDLKATNLLVDRDGRAKVIDFGIARPVDPTSDESGSSLPRTLTGAMYGTPASLSPEQLLGEGDVDVRADVYGLGVVLYRLICDAAPHDLEGLSLPLAARLVTEHEPRRPSSLVAGIPRDLEAILLQSVALDREARYASVAALADDLRRFLASEPVSARNPGALHGLALLARRHRLAFAASLVAVLAVLVGAGASAIFGLRAARDATRARQAGIELRVAAEDARRAEGVAVAAASEAERARADLAAMGMDFVFEFADPIARLKGATEVRAELLRRGVEHLRAMEDVLLEDVDQAYRLCRAYMKFGDVLGLATEANVGDHAGRVEAHDRAWAVLEVVGEKWPDEPRLPTYRSSILSRRGSFLLDAGDRDGAMALFARALEEVRHREAEGPLDSEVADDLALALANYGATLGMAGDDAAALDAFEECLALRRALLLGGPESADGRLQYGHALARVGAAKLRNGLQQDSIDRYTDALAVFDALVVDYPDLDVGLRGGIETRIAFGYVFLETGEAERVEELVDDALVLVNQLAQRDSADVSVDRSTGALLYNTGQARLGRAGRMEDEEDEARELRSAREAFTASREAFERLRSRGAMLTREAGYFDTIDGKLAQIEAALAGR
ncbi:serine/threonine-protein kinase [Engelhardtia mirabilis]|uniref:Serine/threonine-protein kinase PknB n=1 Tax=Engelhardtia mirabilis TaxID=2528011 RepID=A0A518BDR8_9BACT|nr:Serine/threonine-protein kinase PknB [Planctomycetes bacterium Pla133]QDU99457.1 Serine/threonine-protein kinase PknB [Planctomycetes bacterium Pla86]